MMCDSPKVSIIVPVHNAKDTLERTVTSCLGQIGIDFEIILVENASEDGSFELVDVLASKYPKVIAVHAEKRGVSNARNIGLDIANGSYIGFVDADDYIEPDMYCKMIGKLVEDNREIAICDYYIVNQKNTPVKEIVTAEISQIDDKSESVKKALLGQISPSDPVMMGSVWRCLFRRDIIIDKAIRFDEHLAIGEDQVFLLNTLNHIAYVSLVPVPLYHYVISESSASNRKDIQSWKKYVCFFYCLLHTKNAEDDENRMRAEKKVRQLSKWFIKDYIYNSLYYSQLKEDIGEIVNDWCDLLAGSKYDTDLFEWLLIKRYFFLLYLRYNLLSKIKRKVLGAQ